MTRDLIKKSAILLALAATTATAPSAFASNMVETKLTVKISTADLADADGVQKAYSALQTKAEGFCERDTSTLDYLDETVQDCVEDLMEQFIESSDAAPLKAYHEKMAEAAETKTYAMK